MMKNVFKLTKGEKIRSLNHLARLEYVWDDRCKKVYHRGWVHSWQLQFIISSLPWLYTVKQTPIGE